MVSKQDWKIKGSYPSKPSSKKTKQSEEDISLPYLLYIGICFSKFANTIFLSLQSDVSPKATKAPEIQIEN